MQKSARLWLGFVALWAGIGAAQAQGPGGATYPLAAASPDPRFLAFALVQDQPEGWQDLGARIARAQGVAGEGSALRFTLAPRLAWEGNINGGLAASQVRLGGLVFTVDPDTRAVAGGVAGLGVSGRKVWAVAPGQGLQVQMRASRDQALEEDLAITRLSGQVCVTQDLGLWRFADLCLRNEMTERDLSVSRVTEPALTLTRFQAGPWPQRHALRLSREIVAERGRNLMRLEWEAAVPGLGLVLASVEAGAEDAGRNATVARQGLSLHRPFAGAPMGLVLDHRTEAGDLIFGLPRRDQVWTLTVERQLTPRLQLEAGYALRSSSIEGFSDRSFILGLSFAGVSF